MRKASEQNGELQMLDDIRENRHLLGSKSIRLVVLLKCPDSKLYNNVEIRCNNSYT